MLPLWWKVLVCTAILFGIVVFLVGIQQGAWVHHP